MPGPGIELIGEEEKREVLEVLESGHLNRYGGDDPKFQAKTYQLEQEIARLSKVRYAVAANSGTSALLMALGGLGIRPGDEVIVPGYNFIACVSSILHSRAIPVLAEIDRTLNLDPEDVKHKITPRTRAIMVVHMMGNPARLDELKAIAAQHNLFLIEDCAQAFGATYKGHPIGSIGDVGTFSFNNYKIITAGEGGMVITDNEEHYRRYFGIQDHGFTPQGKGGEVIKEPSFFGLSFNMTEVSAAILLAQLRKLGFILSRLRSNKRKFKELITDLPGLEFREITDQEGECATILTVFLPTEEIARKVAEELGTRVVADADWHVYSNMEQLFDRLMETTMGCPFLCSSYTSRGGSMRYRKGMLPQTDNLLSRAINISIGVSDAGLGSAFGVTIQDGLDGIEMQAAKFRRAVRQYVE